MTKPEPQHDYHGSILLMAALGAVATAVLLHFDSRRSIPIMEGPRLDILMGYTIDDRRPLLFLLAQIISFPLICIAPGLALRSRRVFAAGAAVGIVVAAAYGFLLMPEIFVQNYRPHEEPERKQFLAYLLGGVAVPGFLAWHIRENKKLEIIGAMLLGAAFAALFAVLPLPVNRFTNWPRSAWQQSADDALRMFLLSGFFGAALPVMITSHDARNPARVRPNWMRWSAAIAAIACVSLVLRFTGGYGFGLLPISVFAMLVMTLPLWRQLSRLQRTLGLAPISAFILMMLVQFHIAARSTAPDAGTMTLKQQMALFADKRFSPNEPQRAQYFGSQVGALLAVKERFHRAITEAEMLEVLGPPDLMTQGTLGTKYAYFYSRINNKDAVVYIDVVDGKVSMFGFNDSSVNDHSQWQAYKPKPDQ